MQTMTSLFCKPCNKTLSGPAPYLDHIKSAKHQKRVASLEKLESFLDDKGEPAGAATSVPVPENNPFECKVCGVSTNSLGSLETHNRVSLTPFHLLNITGDNFANGQEVVYEGPFTQLQPSTTDRDKTGL